MGSKCCQIFSSAVLQYVPFGDVRACFCVVRVQIQRRAAENGQIHDRELLYVQSPPWPCNTLLLSQSRPSLHMALPPPCPRPFHRILPPLQNSDLDFNTHNAWGSGRG